MRKTTRNQFVTLFNAKASIFLCLCFLLCSAVSFAQLKVNSNTVITANTVVSSKEEANIFDSSILGDNELVLSGENQYLETAKNTSLATLRVVDGKELTIRSELKLRGDLVVQSGVLQLDNPIHVQGKLILENDAILINEHLLIYENQFVFHKEVLNSTNLEVATGASIVINSCTVDLSNEFTEQKKLIAIKNDFINGQFMGMPFSPPPEVVEIAS